MADEAIYKPSRRTLSPEMDAWLRKRGKNPNKVRQTTARVPRLCRSCGQKWTPDTSTTVCPVCESADTIAS